MNSFVDQICETLKEDRAWNATVTAKPLLVAVSFERIGRTLSYYCDDGKIRIGDVVMVDGMLSTDIGVVSDVKLDYVTPPYNMKWIREIVDSEVKGHFFEDGAHMVSLNGSLSPKQYFAMALGTCVKSRPALSARLSYAVEVDSFEYDGHCAVADVFKGRMAYEDGAVTFLSLDEKGHGHACIRIGNVNLATQRFEYVPFYFRNGWVYFETADRARLDKREIAILFQLRTVLKKITSYQKTFVLCGKQDFATVLDYATGHVDITYNYKD